MLNDIWRFRLLGGLQAQQGSVAIDRFRIWDVRHTQVWVEREGQWQLVSWHGTSTSTGALRGAR